jgi:cold-inducible RNA-binding protein
MKGEVISTKIFIGNLRFDTTQQDLANVLQEAGKVVRVHIGTDRETGRSRGFAFAEFGSETEAAEAIRRFDGYDLGGRKLRVNDADDRPPARAAGGPPRAPSVSFAPRDTFMPPAEFAPMDFDGGGGRGNKSKGSRRNLRARKRSLSY